MALCKSTVKEELRVERSCPHRIVLKRLTEILEPQAQAVVVVVIIIVPHQVRILGIFVWSLYVCIPTDDWRV